MDPIQLTFAVDIAAIQEQGVDPTTSEGKATLRQLFLEGIEALLLTNANLPSWKQEVMRQLLREI